MGFNNENSERVVLDIETVASPNAAELLDPIRPPSNYKDEAKIAAYKTEKLAEVVNKAALEADLCEVVSVGIMLPDGRIACATRADCDEADLIVQAWTLIAPNLMDAPRSIIGFNVLGFDLPVLIRRSQLLGLAYPDINLDRYRTPHVDLLERLTFNGKLTYRSLNFYCRRFGISVSDPSLSSQIAEMVAAGDWAAVGSHCRSDVEKTAALARRLGFMAQVQKAQAVA